MQDIKWRPFSNKHKIYIRNGFINKMSVAEGSIRAGKTIDNCIIACGYLETCEDKIHLASGSTIANAKLNIGDCNGFGLEHLFKGRCRWGKYKDNEALFIETKTGQKIVVFAGGGKADSYKKILGNSYGLWIATEINEHYDCDNSKESFVKVALGRQTASIEPKILWDLNPSNPKHKIYTQYIDKYKEQGLLGGYNYEHFTINDNKSISDERKLEIKSMYDENSLWYKRDILGERIQAQGIIYKLFVNDRDKFLLKSFDKKKFNINKITIGGDFGGTKSGTTLTATAICNNYRDVVVLRAERIDSNDLNEESLKDFFYNFVKTVYDNYGIGGHAYLDNEESVLIRMLKNHIIRKGLPYIVGGSMKLAINERIRLTNSLLAQGRLHIVENDCEPLIEALSTALWNDKKLNDERLDDGTTDIDSLDSYEYSIERDYKILMKV